MPTNAQQPDNILTLTTYMFPIEAYPLLAKLEEEGIECYLNDENIVTVQPFLSNAIGGVKIKIKESDSEKALFVLKQFNIDNIKEVNIGYEKWAKDYISVDTYCPKCESHHVYRKKRKLLMSILLVFLAEKNYCADCGYTWK